ncbi:hypothetical protein [Streptomyces longispororuber]|nr:hypothetical protein [Streptomyces longispororuber]MCQ4214003.1 hypothetical protein [Streptomyces longispororuber]
MPKDPYALLRALLRAEATREARVEKPQTARSAQERPAPSGQEKDAR